jgi:hypothetical protein
MGEAFGGEFLKRGVERVHSGLGAIDQFSHRRCRGELENWKLGKPEG